MVEIDLSAEEQRRRILLREDSRMGARKVQEQQVVARAILGTIADEQRDHKALQRADLLPEDRAMLVVLCQNQEDCQRALETYISDLNFILIASLPQPRICLN